MPKLIFLLFFHILHQNTLPTSYYTLFYLAFIKSYYFLLFCNCKVWHTFQLPILAYFVPFRHIEIYSKIGQNFLKNMQFSPRKKFISREPSMLETKTKTFWKWETETLLIGPIRTFKSQIKNPSTSLLSEALKMKWSTTRSK